MRCRNCGSKKHSGREIERAGANVPTNDSQRARSNGQSVTAGFLSFHKLSRFAPVARPILVLRGFPRQAYGGVKCITKRVGVVSMELAA